MPKYAIFTISMKDILYITLKVQAAQNVSIQNDLQHKLPWMNFLTCINQYHHSHFLATPLISKLFHMHWQFWTGLPFFYSLSRYLWLLYQLEYSDCSIRVSTMALLFGFAGHAHTLALILNTCGRMWPKPHTCNRLDSHEILPDIWNKFLTKKFFH